MNNNAKKWVEALRSGEYKQTRSYLSTKDGYCCLGVACDLAVKSGEPIKVEQENPCTIFDGEKFGLPPSVLNWLGLKEDYYNYVQLAYLNDTIELNFTEIANIIEEKQNELFLRHIDK